MENSTFLDESFWKKSHCKSYCLNDNCRIQKWRASWFFFRSTALVAKEIECLAVHRFPFANEAHPRGPCRETFELNSQYLGNLLPVGTWASSFGSRHQTPFWMLCTLRKNPHSHVMLPHCPSPLPRSFLNRLQINDVPFKK